MPRKSRRLAEKADRGNKRSKTKKRDADRRQSVGDALGVRTPSKGANLAEAGAAEAAEAAAWQFNANQRKSKKKKRRSKKARRSSAAMMRQTAALFNEEDEDSEMSLFSTSEGKSEDAGPEDEGRRGAWPMWFDGGRD